MRLKKVLGGLARDHVTHGHWKRKEAVFFDRLRDLSQRPSAIMSDAQNIPNFKLVLGTYGLCMQQLTQTSR